MVDSGQISVRVLPLEWEEMAMPLRFNTLLAEAEIPPSAVRLLRHQDHRSTKGRTPYRLWRDDRPAFETYQESQSFKNRNRLNGHYWASFVVTPMEETLLAGFYRCSYIGINNEERPSTNLSKRNLRRPGPQLGAGFGAPLGSASRAREAHKEKERARG
jgi:hypothetical protein